MRYLYINPHRSDFVYKSPIYQLIGRKSLLKYNYLNELFNYRNTDFLFSNSSLYHGLKKIRFSIIDIFLKKIESILFIKANEKNFKIIFDIQNNYDIAFCFGFAIREVEEKIINQISNSSKYLIIHLSHYHLFTNKLSNWSKYPNVIFCADCDIRENFFFKFYTNGLKNGSFFIVPYVIGSRFNSSINWSQRETKVISTGTFHQFEKMMSSKELNNFSLSSDFGFLTLHPERRIIHKLKNNLPLLFCCNSSMKKPTIFSLLFKPKNINQKGYFSIDLVKEYNRFKFSFIGEESISGLPGIGVFESIACGCIPIVKKGLYKGTPIENCTFYLEYSSIYELIDIINDSESLSRFSLDSEKYSALINEVKQFYSNDYQLKCLTKNISILLKESF